MPYPSSHRAGTLPERWRRGRIAASLSSLAVVALVFYPLSGLSHADALDSWWLAARFTARERLSRPAAPDPDIVIVAEDNRCFQEYEEPLIAWNRHRARVIDHLTQSGARVIAMDWFQPNPTDRWLADKSNDAVLEAALARSHDVVWAIAASTDADKAGDRFVHPYSAFISLGHGLDDPNDYLGFAEVSNGTAVVTAALPTLPDDPSAVSFGTRIVERYRHARVQIGNRSWRVAGGPALPLRSDGTMLIDYANGTGMADFGDRRAVRPFATYSMVDVEHAPDGPDPRFRDKIVLIGSEWSGDNDQHFVPIFNYNSKLLNTGIGLRPAYGLEIQANIVRNLLRGRGLMEPAAWQMWLIAVGLGVVCIGLFLALRWLTAAAAVVGAAVLWIGVGFGAFCIAGAALPIYLPLGAMLLSSGLMGGYLALSEERERRQVLALWGRHQEPRMVDFMLAHPEARGGEGQEMEVTVLFADLKNFTKTVEHLSPTDTISALNRYLGMLNSVICAHGGIVDKYLGDGLMAQWGAPDSPDHSGPNHALAAVRACLDIQRAADGLRRADRPDQAPPVAFDLRLTLHTGRVVFGFVGAQRLELTIIGDIVNVTSRLQETAKQLDVEFLVSENTYERVRDYVEVGEQAEVAIRGRDMPLRVYEVTGARSGASVSQEAAAAVAAP